MSAFIEIQLGSRVYSTLKGPGVVIDLKQASNKRIVTVAFRTGESLKAFDTEIQGTWLLEAGVADQAEICSLKNLADEWLAGKRAAEAEARETFDAELKELRAGDRWSFLLQTQPGEDDTISGKLAAINIRLELRRAFADTKFSVRRPHHGVVNVSWTDGPTAGEVEDLLKKYETGRFDGMQDLASTETHPFNVVFGGSRYIFTERLHSDELIELAITSLYERYAGNLRGVCRPAAIDYNNGELLRILVPGLSMTFQQLLATELNKLKFPDFRGRESQEVSSSRMNDA